ncbi:hypothetical protein SUGI_0025970 [Cryptomeria japonica]|nr:hypothetical protein SUGI_0025970 [Cryptomeria japonica]
MSFYFPLFNAGFLSIDWGGNGTQIDNETGITWIPDDNYVQGGRREVVNDSSLKVYQKSLRVFPKTLRKSCYQLPITLKVSFLLRLSFVGVNYANEIPHFKYSIETQEMSSLRKAANQTKIPLSSEKILVSDERVLYICLIRTSEHVDPFISPIELRSLRQGMYSPTKPGLMMSFKRTNTILR